VDSLLRAGAAAQALDPQLAPAGQRRWAMLGGAFLRPHRLAEMISALFLAMFTVIVLLVSQRRAEIGG
jgi:hypothetical protein